MQSLWDGNKVGGSLRQQPEFQRKRLGVFHAFNSPAQETSSPSSPSLIGVVSLERPPCCNGRIPATQLAAIQLAWSTLCSHTTPAYHPAPPISRTKHGVRRQFSSTGSRRNQDAAGPISGRPVLPAQPMYNSEQPLDEASASLVSKAGWEAEQGTVSPTNSSHVQTDFFTGVLPRHMYGEYDLSHSSPLFPKLPAIGQGSSAEPDRQPEKDLFEAPRRFVVRRDNMGPRKSKRQTPRFRADKGLRALVALWAPSARRLRALEGNPRLYQHALQQEEDKYLDAQSRVVLAATGYTTRNLDTWCWILMSRHANTAVRRYVSTVRLVRKRAARPVPHFVALQILRAPYIHAREFRALLAAIRESSAHHSQRESPAGAHPPILGDLACNADIEAASVSAASSWNGMSAMVLLVRTLRHARVVAPETLDIIIDIAGDLLLDQGSAQTNALSDCCNRLLRLISLPTTAHPIRNILLQQAAQVRLVQRMIKHRPELPITREGYRALISVQLAHKKLQQEVDWARVKSLTWPPWREDRLGMDASLTYPGRESRALKLLHRMNEAGYAHSWWEASAKILAGWDTDNSPTIQTRRLLQTGLADTSIEASSAPHKPPMIWAARIIATRTVREAWAAFLTYRKETLLAFEPLSSEPFEAMFEKLFALPAETQQMSPEVVPGDGKETWNDPASELDVIYVDKEPPTVDELYAQMRKDYIRPGDRFLSDLLANSCEVNEGIKYIKDAQLDQTWKDVLLAAHHHPADVVRKTLQTIRPHLLSAFICHLMSVKSGANVGARVDIFAGSTTSATPKEYALRLLEQSKCQDRVVYIGALKGLLKHGLPAESDRGFAVEKAHVRDIGANVRSVIRLMEMNGVDHDFMTFQYINRLYHWTLKWGPWPRWRTGTDPLSLIKEIFAHCVHDDSDPSKWLGLDKSLPLEAVPDPYHLRILVESLGMFQDIPGLLRLIDWMSKHTAEFRSAHQDIRTAEREMRTVMIVARIFIEGWLTINVRKGAFDTIDAINGKGLYIPTAEDCANFMSSREGWVRRHQRYLQAKASLYIDWTAARDDEGTAQPREQQVDNDYPSA